MLGIDIGTIYTGIAKVIDNKCLIRTVKSNGNFCSYMNDIIRTLADFSADIIVIEDYAYKGSGAFFNVGLPEVGGVVKYAIEEHGLSDVVVSAPLNTVRKWVFGNSRVKENEIVKWANAKFDIDADPHQADALALCEMIRIVKEIAGKTKQSKDEKKLLDRMSSRWKVLKKE